MQDVEIPDYEPTWVDLTWKVPEKDGGRPITHYIVEQKGKYDIDFVQVLETKGIFLKRSFSLIRAVPYDHPYGTERFYC